MSNTDVTLTPFVFGGPPPMPRLWEYYKCVKGPLEVGFTFKPDRWICHKDRVPFFEMSHHTMRVRAPAILPDTAQRLWIHTFYPNVSVWPPKV
jgi:hypothetical protein